MAESGHFVTDICWKVTLTLFADINIIYSDLKFDDKYIVFENGEVNLQDQVIKLGGTYTFDNGEKWNILVTKENIDIVSIDPNIYGHAGMDYYIVILILEEGC